MIIKRDWREGRAKRLLYFHWHFLVASAARDTRGMCSESAIQRNGLISEEKGIHHIAGDTSGRFHMFVMSGCCLLACDGEYERDDLISWRSSSMLE